MNVYISVGNLRCEHAIDPLGVGTPLPRLSWTACHSGRDQRQARYRIQVASTPEMLDAGKADIWDSGEVESAASSEIPHGGCPLSSGADYFWRARIWDVAGNPSGWSATAKFGMGLLHESDWKAQWLASPAPVMGVSPIFRKSFHLDKPVRRARAYVCGLGYHEFRINGRKAGDDVLSPSFTDYAKRLCYSTYDVSDLVRKGENVLGMMLGEGWYGYRSGKGFPVGNSAWSGGTPRFILMVRMDFDDNSTLDLSSAGGDGWLSSTGSIIENSIYEGETYDARLEKRGWDMPGYLDADAGHGWTPVVEATAPGGTLVSQAAEPIRAVEDIIPVSVSSPAPGIHVFDVGQNIAGWARIRIIGGKAGGEVVMKFAETLGRSGLVNQENLRVDRVADKYVMRGDAVETYEPRFTYHGFRYVQVEGLPGLPEEGTLTARIVHSDVKKRGSFVCGNPMINQIQDNVLRTESGNLHSIPTDCPQRDERLGWLNDLTVRLEESIYNFGMVGLLEKFADDIADAQSETSGEIPPVAPRIHFVEGSDKSWEAVCSSFVLLPWLLQVHHGDLRTVERHYRNLCRWNEFLSGKAKDEIIENGWIGDWAPPIAEALNGGAESAHTPQALVSTAYYFQNAMRLAEMAGWLGRDDEKRKHLALAAKIKEAFNRSFFNPEKCTYASGNQASNVFALYFGLVAEGQRGAVVGNLVEEVRSHGYHPTTGNLATRYLLEVLSEEGHVDSAFKIATQDSYPSWGYMIAHGATTVWERWEYATGNGMNSHNHPMYAALSVWFYRHLAGIVPDIACPGFEHFLIRPRIPSQLFYAEGTLDTPRGTILSRWRRTPDFFALEVSVPFNASAHIYFPKLDGFYCSQTICEGDLPVWKDGKEVSAFPGLRSAAEKKDAVVFEVGSGSYHFNVQAAGGPNK